VPDDDAPADEAPKSTPKSTPVALPGKPMVAIDPTGLDAVPTVPRIPRGRGLKLSGGELIKIGMLGTLLVAILILQKPCADSVAKLVTSFGSDGSGSGSASTAMPKPDNVEVPEGYVRLTPDMTPEQVKAAIEQARQQAHGQGSALAPSTPPQPTPPTNPSPPNPSPTNPSPTTGSAAPK
jgi:hypothetical protein